MTQKEFAREMGRLKGLHAEDPEAFHAEADTLMCLMLCELGFEEGVKVFEEAEKWYA